MPSRLWRGSAGGRGRGTTLRELSGLLERSLTVGVVAEPLRCFPAEARAKETRAALEALGFDVCGVTRGGVTVGYALADELSTGAVDQHVRPLTPEVLIAESASLDLALTALRDGAFRFVLRGRDVDAIVTRADMSKPPVRMSLFNVVSLLEMHLAHWVRREHPEEDGWTALLQARRVEKVREEYRRQQAANAALELFDCLWFCDVRELFCKTPALLKQFGCARKEAERQLKRLERLRDQLAHAQLNLAPPNAWEKFLDAVSWAQGLVHASDELLSGA